MTTGATPYPKYLIAKYPIDDLLGTYLNLADQAIYTILCCERIKGPRHPRENECNSGPALAIYPSGLLYFLLLLRVFAQVVGL